VKVSKETVVLRRYKVIDYHIGNKSCVSCVYSKMYYSAHVPGNPKAVANNRRYVGTSRNVYEKCATGPRLGAAEREEFCGGFM